ncbi:hypothetical protein Tco_0538492 [Tanacetum coccineum]
MSTHDTVSDINSELKFYYDEGLMIWKYFIAYTQIETIEEKVDTSQVLDASLVDTKSSGTESVKQDPSSRSGNDAHADDADIKPIYDEEPMAEAQTTAEINFFAIGQHHTEQPEFNNEGEVDQNAEQCHDTCPLPAKLFDNQKTKLSYQSLESENISLKEGQHGQFSNVKSKEAKVKHDIDAIEIINIELKHKVAKLLKENETLKKHYKNLKRKVLQQIASLESKLASQDLLSNQKEYNELRVSYNALKVKLDTVNRDKRNSHVSKPRVSVPKKVYTGESSKAFSKKVKQVWRPKQRHSEPLKYSRSDLLSLRPKIDSASISPNSGRFSFISKMIFGNAKLVFNNT